MVLPLFDDQDVNLCLVYLQFKLENPSATMQQVADHMGYTRKWVYELLAKWRQNGAMDHARKLIMASRNQSIQSALDNVVDKWPLVINGILADALSPAVTAHVRLKAAEFLKETVIDGYLAGLPKGESEERHYLEVTTEESFNPIDIPHILELEDVPPEEIGVTVREDDWLNEDELTEVPLEDQVTLP